MNQPDVLILSVNDESIIDVTNQWEMLPVQQELDMDMQQGKCTDSKYLNIPVPFWQHWYIYSYDDLYLANAEQKAFYMQFRSCFFKQKYVDIGENSNYAFILLSDLLRLEYNDSKQLKMLEENIFRLIEYYPITKPYALKGLMKKMQTNNFRHSPQKFQKSLNNHYQSKTEEPEMRARLGDKFKKKLALFDSEVKVLNRIPESSNAFLQIEFCYIAVVKFYLLVIKQMNETFKSRGTSLDAEFKIIAEIVYSKRKEHLGDHERLYESSIDYIYIYVMYFCEVTVREKYGYNKKLSNYFELSNVRDELATRIEPVLQAAILSNAHEIIQLDKAAEIKLIAISNARWEPKFDEILNFFSKDNAEDGYAKILNLAELYQNVKRAKVTIYFEAFKHMAKFDKIRAVQLYLLYVDAESRGTIKGVTVAAQKKLFTNENQLNKFEEIKSKLVHDKISLEGALQSIPDIYAVIRKKITLDKSQVKEIHKHHLDTAQLLGEYLNDEAAEGIHQDPLCRADKHPQSHDIASDHLLVDSSLTNIKLNQVQCELIKLFANSNFVLSVNELEKFATNKKAFKNSLIEGINETCYDTLDDLLIEQADDSYSIDPNYYKRIFTE